MNIDFDSIIDAIARFGLDLIGAIVLLIVTWIISRWARKATSKSLAKSNLDETLTKFFGNLVGWGILILGVIAILGIFGISTASFAAVLAAAGLAIGLAFQGTLSNFAAGVMLLVFRPFKVGDVIRAAGETGGVVELDLLVTKLDTLDNRRIIVPNSKIFGDTIENITFHPIRRVDVPVGVDYGADLDEVRAVLVKAAASVEGGLSDPPPQIFLGSLDDSAVTWDVRVWCNTGDYFDVLEATTRATKQALDAAGIGIPFPQLDVHHLGGAPETP